LQAYLYALERRAVKWKHLTGITLCPGKMGIKEETLTGIPLCPGMTGMKEETPYSHTFMP